MEDLLLNMQDQLLDIQNQLLGMQDQLLDKLQLDIKYHLLDMLDQPPYKQDKLLCKQDAARNASSATRYVG
jgi:hypothetical protein